jgi:hypothetical protein
MKRTDTLLISKVLEAYMEENPLLSEKLAETRLIDSWEKVLGPLVMRYTGSIYVKNQCLYVKLNSAVVKNELMMCREKLIQNLNKEAGRKVINNIIYM